MSCKCCELCEYEAFRITRVINGYMVVVDDMARDTRKVMVFRSPEELANWVAMLPDPNARD